MKPGWVERAARKHEAIIERNRLMRRTKRVTVNKPKNGVRLIKVTLAPTPWDEQNQGKKP